MRKPQKMLPVALVTGASRRLGIGFAVAQQLARRNYHVILAARNLEQSEELAFGLCHQGFRASAIRLDLADSSSIADVAATVGNAFSHVDVLINNASHMPDFQTACPLDVDIKVLRALFEVNVFGCWHLTQALLPLLKRARAARIVNVTSSAAQQIGKPRPGPIFSPAYSLAKHTLNNLTVVLAQALANTAVKVNAIDPGSVATHPERGDNAFDRSPEEAAKDVVWAATLDAAGPSGCIFSAARR
ncbi:SDR family NAD(P)-dependent oxidoreductase [Agrobacterium tumefaciens]|nr:SDR family NAD(P)-dependent oxidoreductase [Agrobacterium tumefaciens]